MPERVTIVCLTVYPGPSCLPLLSPLGLAVSLKRWAKTLPHLGVTTTGMASFAPDHFDTFILLLDVQLHTFCVFAALCQNNSSDYTHIVCEGHHIDWD